MCFFQVEGFPFTEKLGQSMGSVWVRGMKNPVDTWSCIVRIAMYMQLDLQQTGRQRRTQKRVMRHTVVIRSACA